MFTVSLLSVSGLIVDIVSICVYALHWKDTFGDGFREQSCTDPLNMLLKISDSTDQIRNESQSRSYRYQVVTLHQIKVTWDRLWTSHKAIRMTFGSHLKYSIVIEHATAIAQTTTVCSLINRPFLVSPFFATGHHVLLLQIKKGRADSDVWQLSKGIWGYK